MASIGTGAAAVVPFTIPQTVYSASLQGGAAVVFDSTNKGVKAPGGAAALGFAGLITNQQSSTGTASGDRVDLQIAGVGVGILDAGQSVTFGQELIISDTDGSLKGFALASNDDCSIVGYSLETKTAGAANESLLVQLMPFNVHKDNS